MENILMMINQFKFQPLCLSDFQLMHDWFNHPHVQEFYSLRPWTLEDVENKLRLYLDQTSSVKPYIVYLEERPIAFIQYSFLSYNPWPDQDFSEKIVKEGVGIDVFIGEKKDIGRGLGVSLIQACLEELIWPSFNYCVADPDVRNTRSIRLFEKCGFTHHKCIQTHDPLGQPVVLQLMIKKKGDV